MAKNAQAQADTTGETTTADETPASGAPASDETQPTTPATQQSVPPAGAVVEDYETRLAKALNPAPAEPEGGDIPPEEIPPAETETPSTETPADETPPEQTPAPQSTEFRPRLSKLDERQKEAILLVKERAEKGETISLSEAEARVLAKYGETPQAPKAEDEAPAAPRTPDEIRAEIATQKQARRAAKLDMDPEKEFEAEDRIEALQAELQKSEAAIADEATTQEKDFYDEVDKATARAHEIYPVMDDEKHAIHGRAKEIWSAFIETENPIIHDPKASLKVYQMAANDLGIAPGAKPQSSPTAPKNGTPRPQAVAQQAVITTPRVAPASGAARTQNGSQPSPPVPRAKNAAEYEAFLEKIGA